jgi:hypothetical protein
MQISSRKIGPSKRSTRDSIGIPADWKNRINRELDQWAEDF